MLVFHIVKIGFYYFPKILIFCPEKENKNLKIFGWDKSPIDHHIF